MSQSVRTQTDRNETSQRLNEAFMGVMVSATAYNGNVRMVDCKVPVPSTAAFAGKLDNVLPNEGE